MFLKKEMNSVLNMQSPPGNLSKYSAGWVFISVEVISSSNFDNRLVLSKTSIIGIFRTWR